jgi:hypothetical protein
MKLFKCLVFCFIFSLLFTEFISFAWDNKTLQARGYSSERNQKREQVMHQFKAERLANRQKDKDALVGRGNPPVAGTIYETEILSRIKLIDGETTIERKVSIDKSLREAEKRRADVLLDKSYQEREGPFSQENRPNSCVAIFMRVNNELKQAQYFDPAVKPLYRVGSYDTLYEHPEDAAHLRSADHQMMLDRGWLKDSDLAKALLQELKIYRVDGYGNPLNEADIAFKVILESPFLDDDAPIGINIRERITLGFYDTEEEAEAFVKEKRPSLLEGYSLHIGKSIFFNPLLPDHE